MLIEDERGPGERLNSGLADRNASFGGKPVSRHVHLVEFRVRLQYISLAGLAHLTALILEPRSNVRASPRMHFANSLESID